MSSAIVAPPRLILLLALLGVNLVFARAFYFAYASLTFKWSYEVDLKTRLIQNSTFRTCIFQNKSYNNKLSQNLLSSVDLTYVFKLEK